MIATMLDMIAKTGRGTEQNRLVITHCNNVPLANEMKERIESLFDFHEVVIFTTGGLSSLYTDEGGIVLAF